VFDKAGTEERYNLWAEPTGKNTMAKLQVAATMANWTLSS
jgi:hypothetical protein